MLALPIWVPIGASNKPRNYRSVPGTLEPVVGEN
jgi:hypothetical protein